MADEYIRREDAVMQLSHNKRRGDDEWELAVESDMDIIKALPPADVVQVVRCKDCKFYTSMRADIKTGICDLNVHHMGDDGFCSHGERKG